MINLAKTIRSRLAEAIALLSKQSESAQLDAEVLLCHVLGKERVFLRTWPERELDDEQIRSFFAYIEQRRQGIPVAYLTGTREFWSREFLVNPAVLIPRPETELLIELCLNLMPAEDQDFKVLDLGTGSGIIAVTLAAERAKADVYACDASTEALAVARENANRHGQHRIHFYQSDWFSQVPALSFDIIVSNPPYIDSNDSHLASGDVRFEPRSALVAERQGLADIERIAMAAPKFFAKPGHLLVEHGYDQQEAVKNLFINQGYHNVATHADLAGNPRATYGLWPG